VADDDQGNCRTPFSTFAPALTIIRQCIRGSLLDELRLHIVHIILGGGTALFGGLDPADVALDRIGLIDADGETHLTFRLTSPSSPSPRRSPSSWPVRAGTRRPSTMGSTRWSSRARNTRAWP
jgi:hypothetical protein